MAQLNQRIAELCLSLRPVKGIEPGELEGLTRFTLEEMFGKWPMLAENRTWRRRLHYYKRRTYADIRQRIQLLESDR